MLKVGDIVTLRNFENIKMTINEVGNQSVQCVWFDLEDKLYRQMFSKDALVLFKAKVPNTNSVYQNFKNDNEGQEGVLELVMTNSEALNFIVNNIKNTDVSVSSRHKEITNRSPCLNSYPTLINSDSLRGKPLSESETLFIDRADLLSSESIDAFISIFKSRSPKLKHVILIKNKI